MVGPHRSARPRGCSTTDAASPPGSNIRLQKSEPRKPTGNTWTNPGHARRIGCLIEQSRRRTRNEKPARDHRPDRRHGHLREQHGAGRPASAIAPRTAAPSGTRICASAGQGSPSAGSRPPTWPAPYPSAVGPYGVAARAIPLRTRDPFAVPPVSAGPASPAVAPSSSPPPPPQVRADRIGRGATEPS